MVPFWPFLHFLNPQRNPFVCVSLSVPYINLHVPLPGPTDYTARTGYRRTRCPQHLVNCEGVFLSFNVQFVISPVPHTTG